MLPRPLKKTLSINLANYFAFILKRIKKIQVYLEPPFCIFKFILLNQLRTHKTRTVSFLKVAWGVSLPVGGQ